MKSAFSEMPTSPRKLCVKHCVVKIASQIGLCKHMRLIVCLANKVTNAAISQIADDLLEIWFTYQCTFTKK